MWNVVNNNFRTIRNHILLENEIFENDNNNLIDNNNDDDSNSVNDSDD